MSDRSQPDCSSISPRRGQRRAKRRRPLLVAIAVTLGSLVGIATVIAVVASIFLGNLAHIYGHNTATIPKAFPTSKRPAPTDGMNILLIGSDSRQQRDPDAGRATDGRSDTLMLAHIPADRKAVYLMSIMRDAWVPIPGHGTAKINAAYSWGGVPLTVQTVEQRFDIRIDHVAEISFGGFRDMTNALGGVDVNSDRGFTGQGHTFQSGTNHLDGDAALAFVRERHAFADADHSRVRHQQAFMRGITEKLLSRGTLTNPGRIQEFITATSHYLQVDPTLTFTRLADIGWSLRSIRGGDLKTFTVPTAGGGTSADGQSYVMLNDTAVNGLSAALRSDDVGSWLSRQH